MLMELMGILRAVFGLFYTLFLPGFFAQRAILDSENLNKSEQAIVSVAMSVAIVPVTILIFIYLFKVPFGTMSVFFEILASIAFFILVGFVKKIRGQKTKTPAFNFDSWNRPGI